MRGSGSSGVIRRNLPLAIGVLICTVIMQLTNNPHDDFTEYVHEKPGTEMPQGTPIPKHQPSGKNIDPNSPEFTDPSDLAAEDEGMVEDSSIIFNPKSSH